MKQDVKQKWVEALRSGDYEQGTGQLRSQSGGFCCLGVLCDLHAKETGTAWKPTMGRPGSEKSDILNFWNYGGHTVNITEEVRRWAGVDGYHIEVENGGVQIAVANLNDGGMKFPEIADLIEASL